MNRNVATILFSFAAMLVVLGLFSAFYSPDHQIGWNEKGKSGLIVCGVGAVLSIIIGLLSDRGASWGVYAGLVVAFLFIAVPGKNFFAAGRAWSGGDAAMWFRTVIFGGAFFAALRTFVALSLIARRGKQP
jgi:hypothetical protein